MISNTGVWTAVEAKQSGYPKSETLAKRLCDVFEKNKWVIDFGCGDGYYIHHLHFNNRFKVIGVDGYIHKKGKYLNPFPTDFIQEYDLTEVDYDTRDRGQVLCLEVGEHIPVEHEQTFIDNICRHCTSRLVLSWAIEGQPGIGHVNCRNNDYIIDQITRRGFVFNEDITQYLRNDIELHNRYFKDTLMVFDKI